MAPGRRRTAGRLSEIGRVATRHGFGYLLERRRTPADDAPSDRGRRLREMLDELGPTFVKFGQVLSTRPDVVPQDIVAELRKLQDDVTPFPFAQVEEVIRADLGLTIERAFRDFEEEPIAAASIGQVHRATLPNGDPVIVKVQRPDAPRQIESDLALLRSAAKFAREKIRALDFIDTHALVEEFGRSIREELDYKHEARNAEAFYRNFAGSPSVVIPKVARSYSTERVLTLERLVGTQIGDIDLSARTPEQRRALAHSLTDAWMTMIFRHGVFHGDPHPANILVLEDGRLGLVDFGLAGTLTDEDMGKLTRLFVDAATENLDMLPRRLTDLGVRYPREREDDVRAAIDDIYYRYYGVGLSEIDPVEVIREALDLIYSLNLRLPTRFVILDKAIATLGSVAVEIYPDFNVFEVARPYAQALIAERYSPRRMAVRTQRGTSELLSVASRIPYQVTDVLENLRDGELEVRISNPGIDDLSHRIDVSVNRIAVSLIILGGLVGSSIVGVLAKEGPHVMGLHLFSFVGFIVSGIFGLWLIWGIVRSGRL
jgi:ubiquinone biosynthesis protein